LTPSNGTATAVKHPAQYQLAPERQYTLAGQLEPLLAPPPAPPAPAPPSSPSGELFAALQLPLPLQTIHQLENGAVAKACNAGRGFHASTCPEHPEAKPTVHPHVCGVQRCESSREVNSKERARDAWNGTADKGERIGLRHLSSVPWAVFVWTLPAELRAACVGERLKKFRHAAQQMTEEVLQRHGAGRDAQFYGRSWLHPVGDAELPIPGCDQSHQQEDGTTYKPHENVLVPLVFLRGGHAHRLRPHLPKSWLGAEGWVQEAWREKLVAVFGQWWPTDNAPPVANWFYEYREGVEQQRHALRYFSRVFPSWAGHRDVRARPRSWGLAHWKRKDELLELVRELPEREEYSACPHSKPSSPCPPALTVGASTAERVLAVLERLLERYAQERRIMGKATVQATSPPLLEAG
jgi:hypothetical protein